MPCWPGPGRGGSTCCWDCTRRIRCSRWCGPIGRRGTRHGSTWSAGRMARGCAPRWTGGPLTWNWEVCETASENSFMKLIGRLAHPADLTPRERDAMFTLMDRHYARVRRSAFETDLDEKQWVILVLEPGTEAVCGFSTQMLLEVKVAGRTIKALFSGDTIIAREHW